jgi:hypothetical protein
MAPARSTRGGSVGNKDGGGRRQGRFVKTAAMDRPSWLCLANRAPVAGAISVGSGGHRSDDPSWDQIRQGDAPL